MDVAEKCDACNGRLEEDFISDYASMAVDQRPCGKCRGDGVLRTGPHRLADGTWSDGVDRRLRLVDRGAPGRWEVWQDSWGDWVAWLNTDGNIESFEFPTHAEAIAYADNLARTTKNGDNK